jgi:hypothetical protein
MIRINPIKMLMLFALSILIFTYTAQAQDSLKLSTQKQLNWLIKLAHADIDEVDDSLEVKGYKPVREIENGTSFNTIYRIKGNTNLISIISDDGEHISACCYSTDNKAMYEQAIALIKAMGFERNAVFDAKENELAFDSKNNDLIVFSPSVFQNKPLNTIATSKLNPLLP